MAIKKPVVLYNNQLGTIKDADQLVGSLNFWRANTDYFQNQSLVIYNKKIYIALLDHTSNVGFEFDLTNGKWEEMHVSSGQVSIDSSGFHLVLDPADDTLNEAFSKLDTVIDDNQVVLNKTWSSSKIKKESIKNAIVLG